MFDSPTDVIAYSDHSCQEKICEKDFQLFIFCRSFWNRNVNTRHKCRSRYLNRRHLRHKLFHRQQQRRMKRQPTQHRHKQDRCNALKRRQKVSTKRKKTQERKFMPKLAKSFLTKIVKRILSTVKMSLKISKFGGCLRQRRGTKFWTVPGTVLRKKRKEELHLKWSRTLFQGKYPDLRRWN